MARRLQLERRHLRHAHRFSLILAILFSPGFARIAAAAAPAFQGTFREPIFWTPRGLALSPSGDVFVGDDSNGGYGGHLAQFTGAGTLTDTWAFSGGTPVNPDGVAVDGSSVVFVTDPDHNRIRKYTRGFVFSSFVTAFQPVDIALNGADEVFVVALGGQQVQKFTNGGSLLATIGSAGVGPGQFQDPQGIAVDGGGRIYVADFTRMRILRFLASGSFDMEFATPGSPADVAVGPDGNVYVVGVDMNRVYQYSSSGALLLSFQPPDGLHGAYRIAISPTGAMYISERYYARITRFQIDHTTSIARTTFGRLKAMYR